MLPKLKALGISASLEEYHPSFISRRKEWTEISGKLTNIIENNDELLAIRSIDLNKYPHSLLIDGTPFVLTSSVLPRQAPCESKYISLITSTWGLVSFSSISKSVELCICPYLLWYLEN